LTPVQPVPIFEAAPTHGHERNSTATFLTTI